MDNIKQELSLCEIFALLPKDIQQKRFANLSEEEAEFLLWDWQFYGRPSQQLPKQQFIQWLILAGRGWGKTRTGAEAVKEWVKTSQYVNLIGATADDARDIMIEGESGILAICPKNERPIYKKSDRQLSWSNGAKSLIFTADEPERLRGKQHEKLWCDELCSWRYEESWAQASFGLRLGKNPQAIITTTPKPTKLLKEIMADSNTIITRGITTDNRRNLAEMFVNKIIKKYEGTRLGRQELNAEVLDDNPSALWKRKDIDELRVAIAPEMQRITVNIDPSSTSNSTSDEAGITVTGLGVDGHGYLLEDLSLQGTPKEWATAAVAAYHRWKADRIIAETNNGGEMIETVIRMLDSKVSYKSIHASKGKITRAEPISALYEQKQCHHVGFFPALEDQMCEYDQKASRFSPDRMDSLVWGFTELMTEPQNELRIRGT